MMFKNKKRSNTFTRLLLFVGVGVLIFVAWFMFKINALIGKQKSTQTSFQQPPENIKTVVTIPSNWQWFTSNDGVIKFAYPKNWGDLKQQSENDPLGSYEGKFMHPPRVTKKKDLLVQIGKGFEDYTWYLWDDKTNSLVSAVDMKPPNYSSLETYQAPIDLGSIEKMKPFVLDTTKNKAIYEVLGKGAKNCGAHHYFFDVADSVVHLTAILCNRDGEWQPKSGQAYSDVVEDPLKNIYKYIEE